MLAVEVAEVTRIQAIRDRFARAAGEIVSAAWVMAVVGAFPIALRLRPVVAVSTLGAWLAVSALGLPAALAAQLLIRAGAAGFRAAVPARARRSVLLSSLALWISSSTVVLGAFATVLSAVTHHRGLGATTFAIVGLALTIGCGLVAVRLAGLFSRWLARPAVSWALLALSAAAPVAWIHLALRHASDSSRPGMTAVADACTFAVMAVVASRIRLPERTVRYSVPASLVLAVATLVAGTSPVAALARAGDDARARSLLLTPVLDQIREPEAGPRPAPSPPAQTASHADPPAAL